MTGEQGVRRSGRQTSETKFFVPHFDPSYASPLPSPKPLTEKPEATNTRFNSKSGESSKKRGPTEQNLTDSVKKQKKNTSDLPSDDNLEDQENTNIFANEDTPGSSQSSSKRKAKNSAPKKTSSARKPRDVPTGPKNRKTKFEKVNEQLKAIGVSPSENNGNCARAAIYRGSIKLTGNRSDLNQIILSGTLECGHNCDATLGKLLKQPDYAGLDYEDGCQEATVVCNQFKSGKCDMGRTYVTRICGGYPEFDSGKFHNHCTRCNNFGKCIGDYREAHCAGCNGHYFAGSGGQFGCSRCGDSDSEGRDDCVLM